MSVAIALVGDRNPAHASHRDLDAVRGSYGPGPDEVERLVSAGMVVEATAHDAGAEVLELPANRFFVLTLFQPHVGALAGKPLHPLLHEFVRCARAYDRERQVIQR